MSSMEIHVLDARGALRDIRDWVRDRLVETHGRAAALLPLGPLDVVVQAGRRIVPEKGHLGFAPRAGVVFLTLDPGHPALRANEDASLERMFAHELHHAARWDGPGYGPSLGEALVSEGLAGHFAQELFGGPPEPWEGLPPDEIRPFAAEAERDWDRIGYDHEAWFFGRGELPRWLGYSFGFRLVGRYLAENPGSRASALSGAAARDFASALARI